MKKVSIILALFLSLSLSAQEHFTGLSTSSRGGIIASGINPAELSNLNHRFEANIYGMSLKVANNKIGFKDIVSGDNIENLLFQGTEPVNMRVGIETYGPGLAFKINRLTFAVTTKANLQMDVIDVDVNFGNALINDNLTSLVTPTVLNTNFNQRITGVVWGEVGLSAARSIIDNAKHKFSTGVTLKLLFPGAFTNLGLSKLSGTLSYNAVDGNIYLNNVNNASLNIAYSGNLANSFTDFNDYSKSVFGALGGFVGDIGFNYQLKSFNPDDKDKKSSKYKNKYKLNAGLSFRNIGSMTFKNDNYNTNYLLNIQSKPGAPLGLNLDSFSNVDGVKDVETTLSNNGYLTKQANNNDLKIKLPTTITAYADVKLIPKVFLSGYIQQKLGDEENNDQISSQNILTITPRFNTGFFEAFVPLSSTEIAGFNAGFGFRLGGFYLGSGSIVSALMSDTKEADIYLGAKWGFL